MPKKPATQKAIIEQLWYDIRGEDGTGIYAMTHENHDHIVTMKEDMAFIKGRIEGQVETAKPSTKSITVRRFLEAGVTALVLALVVGGFLLIALGTLTPGDIIQMLAAWKGGG